MKICLDDGLSTTVELIGIGHQCLGLFEQLKTLTEVVLADYRYLRFFPRHIRRAAYLFLANAVPISTSFDVAHYINVYVPKTRWRAAKVVTIHDLAMFCHPETVQPQYLPYIRRAVVLALQRADLIITPSYAIKNEILQFFPRLAPERIFVCFNGLRDIFRSGHDASQFEKNFRQNRPFFLFVGILHERKNLRFLVAGFLEARRRGAISKETILLLVGKKGYGYKLLEHAIAENECIKMLGHVSDEELVSLYRQARAFVFPSHYEGFGIPLLEAMSCNTPIIRSEIAASRELDDRHNAQMFAFPLHDRDKLVERLAELDLMSESMRIRLDYGDLSMYQFKNVAQQHIKAYEAAMALKSKTGARNRAEG